MADTLNFDLVSPERRVASFAATEVQIPAAAGDMTAMADHEPTITNLRPGILRATGPEGTQEFLVTGGFAEITGGGATVLAERAMARDTVTQEIMDDLIAQAQKARETAPADEVDAATKLLMDMVAAGTEIGLDTKHPNL